jgi:hypothetical protein
MMGGSSMRAIFLMVTFFDESVVARYPYASYDIIGGRCVVGNVEVKWNVWMRGNHLPEVPMALLSFFRFYP